jgi:hypothetical protein
MKHLAFLGFAIATLMAPIPVQAQQCVTFPQPPNAEAELRYLLSHPGVRVCPLNYAPSATQDDPEAAEAAAIAELQRRYRIGQTLLNNWRY